MYIYDLNRNKKDIKNSEKGISNESIKNCQIDLLKRDKTTNLIKKFKEKRKKKRRLIVNDKEKSDSKTDIKFLLFISKTHKRHKESDDIFNNSKRRSLNNKIQFSSIIKKK